MRKLPCLVLLLSATVGTVRAQHGAFTLRETDERVIVNLRAPAPHDGGFTAIDLTIRGKSFHITPGQPVDCIPKDEGKRSATGLIIEKISGMTLDASRCFFRGSYSANSKVHTLLLFVGQPGASNPGSTLILGFDSTGKPFKVLERAEFDVYRLETTASGEAHIIGDATLSEQMSCLARKPDAPYVLTYDPTSVYVVHDGQPAAYSLTESQSYNIKHYVWAGPDSREDYGVIFNLPGHTRPVGASLARINALMKKFPCQS